MLARLRSAAMEIEDALDPAAERRGAEEREQDRGNLEFIRSGQREGRGWGVDGASPDAARALSSSWRKAP
jgi:hypothetical protein